MTSKKAFHFILLILMLSRITFAQRFSVKQMQEVISIAKFINLLNPNLEESKYLEYAGFIYEAADKYSIDPMVLIAIAQQETGFRENLPEGKAGEIGILQIRKMWLNNSHFVREFKKQNIVDLKNPAKSFLFAAWILKGLQGSSTSKDSLPYWSYYNSVHFESRFKYFLAVNRNIIFFWHLNTLDGQILSQNDKF